MAYVRTFAAWCATRLNRKPARIPPVRSRRQHLLARRGQRPFRALLHHETQRDEFVADGVGGELGAAVGEAFEGGALGLAEDQQFLFFLVGHSGGLLTLFLRGAGKRFCPPRCDWRTSSQVSWSEPRVSDHPLPQAGGGERAFTPRRCRQP